MFNVNGEDKRLNYINEIRNLSLPIFVWGREATAKRVVNFLRHNGIDREIRFVVDDEYYIDGCDAVKFSDYMIEYAASSIMIFGFYNYKLIMKKRNEYETRIKHLYDFHPTVYGGGGEKWKKKDVIINYEQYKRTYDLLEDDKSRKTMELFLRAAVDAEFDELYKKCHVDAQYFNDVTNAQNIDVLIDCGAFDGDSIHAFVNIFHKYEKIYAFEPDESNRRKLKQRIERENIEKVEVLPYGVYKEKTTLFFSNDGTMSSHLASDGIAVNVTTIDNFLGNSCTGKNVLIKMDIEGSELDALAGAKNMIFNNHPCLTICVYHKKHDLIDIPQYINQLVGDGVYKYYLRFHGDDLNELVFYAVPVK